MKRSLAFPDVSCQPHTSVRRALLVFEYPCASSQRDRCVGTRVRASDGGLGSPECENLLATWRDCRHRTITYRSDDGFGCCLQIAHPSSVARSAHVLNLEVYDIGVSPLLRGEGATLEYLDVDIESPALPNEQGREPLWKDVFSVEGSTATEDACSWHDVYTRGSPSLYYPR